jgi:catalase
MNFVSQTPGALHMVTWVKRPRGIPANYREMEKSGVNTYDLVNDQGLAHHVKFHWQPEQGMRNLTAAPTAEIQAQDVGHATKDLYDAIERGDYPEWEFCVHIMAEGDHAERECDPLDDTKRWPEDCLISTPIRPCAMTRARHCWLARLTRAMRQWCRCYWKWGRMWKARCRRSHGADDGGDVQPLRRGGSFAAPRRPGGRT